MEWVWVDYHYILEFTKLYVVYEQLKRQQEQDLVPVICSICTERLKWKALSVCLMIWQAFSFLLAVLKAGSSCWKLHFKDPQENQDDVQ